MDTFIKGSEVIQVAIKIEENGYAFYRFLANLAVDETLKETFLFLAEEEKGHIESFRYLFTLLKQYQVTPEKGEEYRSHLQTLADLNVFTKDDVVNGLSQKIKNEEEAISFAMSFERDSILFFYEIREMLAESDKKVIEALIDQEKSHLSKLAGLRKVIQEVVKKSS
ncbi:MAG: ferritin family protein [Thermodesulfobacteriota bacterium]|nr:ferritin family protein [Thermodesulfobacteriota bacterium]